MRCAKGEYGQLLALMEEAFSKSLSFEETYAIQVRLRALLRPIPHSAAPDFDEAALTFRRWLDDWDVRQRDSDYADATTARLKESYRLVVAAAEHTDGL